MVKYIDVFGQIKAADQKFATTKNGDENSKKFGVNLDDFWPRHCRAKVLDLSRAVETYL